MLDHLLRSLHGFDTIFVNQTERFGKSIGSTPIRTPIVVNENALAGATVGKGVPRVGRPALPPFVNQGFGFFMYTGRHRSLHFVRKELGHLAEINMGGIYIAITFLRSNLRISKMFPLSVIRGESLQRNWRYGHGWL